MQSAFPLSVPPTQTKQALICGAPVITKTVQVPPLPLSITKNSFFKANHSYFSFQFKFEWNLVGCFFFSNWWELPYYRNSYCVYIKYLRSCTTCKSITSIKSSVRSTCGNPKSNQPQGSKNPGINAWTTCSRWLLSKVQLPSQSSKTTYLKNFNIAYSCDTFSIFPGNKSVLGSLFMLP